MKALSLCKLGGEELRISRVETVKDFTGVALTGFYSSSEIFFKKFKTGKYKRGVS
jgi:hypothetical protein